MRKTPKGTSSNRGSYNYKKGQEKPAKPGVMLFKLLHETARLNRLIVGLAKTTEEKHHVGKASSICKT
eukprot:scaffold3437_cov113-Cylindrotheca_fusiformis.AAC.18